MSEITGNILVVDDSLPELQMTVGFLKQHFQVSAATSGERALEMIHANKPSLVLLDVSMPGMNGYEVCRLIREHDKYLKVIFVSANDTTDEILKGYMVGGNDYVVKPFSLDILLLKINQAISSNTEMESVSQQAAGLAMEAMTSFGELGSVLTFLRSSFRIGNVEALAALIIHFLESYDLEVCLQLRTASKTKNYSSRNEITPLEEELLSRISKMSGRFAESGQRMFMNYEHASLIIKNMPYDDDFKMGRLRDNLAIMLEGVDEKLSILSFEEGIEAALVLAQETHRKIEADNLAVVERNLEEFTSALLSLSLTDDQERSLLEIVSKSQVEINRNFNGARIVEEQLGTVKNLLQTKLVDEKPAEQDSGSFDFL